MDKLKELGASFINLWHDRHKLAEKSLPTDLKNFLPPSLEVLEKPPHPVPRVLLFVVAAVCLVGLIWAFFGKVDIITVAEGKIIPSGKVREIQPFDRGVVSAILVHEGQMVTKGQPLIELDQTQTEADRFRYLSELDYVKRKMRRKELLAALLNRAEDPTPEEISDLAPDPAEAKLLYEEYSAMDALVEALKSQHEERLAELEACQESIKQYEATLPLITERAERMRELFNKTNSTLQEYYSLEEERLRQRHTLAAEKKRYLQITSAIETAAQQIKSQEAKNLSEVLNELDDLKRQAEALNQELTKTTDLKDKQVLYAPVAGTVKGLTINTVGGVVNPAQVLMEVVPLGETLEVEAFVSNNDIGYVAARQPAEVKVNTFPFTKYGVIDAEVVMVADDATVDEKLGLIYRTRLALKKSTIMVEGKEVQLLPGMAVSAEIATGQRRLIEFFLAPLLRMKQEGLRER